GGPRDGWQGRLFRRYGLQLPDPRAVLQERRLRRSEPARELINLRSWRRPRVARDNAPDASPARRNPEPVARLLHPYRRRRSDVSGFDVRGGVDWRGRLHAGSSGRYPLLPVAYCRAFQRGAVHLPDRERAHPDLAFSGDLYDIGRSNRIRLRGLDLAQNGQTWPDAHDRPDRSPLVHVPAARRVPGGTRRWPQSHLT